MWVQVVRRLGFVGLLVACAPQYQSATLSTLGPKSRVTLADSTRLEIQSPDVRHDTLYSKNARPIPTDSITRVEAERRVNQAGVLAAIAGAIAGLAIAHAAGGL